MIPAPELTQALKKLVLRVEDDLRVRLADDTSVEARWRDEHRGALKAGRTAGAWESYRDDKLTQVAVSWVLTTVFVRFCEDNSLLEPVWISGPRHRRQEALDAERAHFQRYPTETSREWVWQAVRHLESVRATAGLVDEYAPFRQLKISGDMATEILRFWRASDDEGGLVSDFADPELSTRFLGDLYQDLSDHAKKTYALLQTPVFVEEFILDQTLTPAMEERPLAGFRLIDPTCGSGHFLLGAFDRFLAAWAAEAPELDTDERVRRALASVHGVDINPFAVAIARFRLVVATLKALGLKSLETAPDLDLNLAAGDSLLPWNEPRFDFEEEDEHLFSSPLEDEKRLHEMLQPGSYDVVVGNPPYITVKDKALNQQYRKLYQTCHRKYALTVPFMERFFQLAHSEGSQRPSGWVGQITSNSFMKREFGEKLIEEFLVDRDLRLVVDSSGAYIPGHGTPTVIMIGRSQPNVSPTIRTVMGVRGEPGQPVDPATGLVWQEIMGAVDHPGFEGTFVSVSDLPVTLLAKHPWSLSGGGAVALLEQVNAAQETTLGACVDSIGFAAITGEDPVFLSDGNEPKSWGRDGLPVRGFVDGESVRDFAVSTKPALYPYLQSDPLPDAHDAESLWPFRSTLRAGLAFGKTRQDSGKHWYEYILPSMPRLQADTLLSFAFVATHNHFVLDRGGKVFNQSAPVIKLPAGSTEEDHLALLGVLNSSTACFWLKQNSYSKGSATAASGIPDQPWTWNWEFTGTTLKDFPLPSSHDTLMAQKLDQLAQDSYAKEPAGLCEQLPSLSHLKQGKEQWESIREEMVGLQEELDWSSYGAYGLLANPPLFTNPPRVRPEERAFAIVLARQAREGNASDAWFSHWNHGYTPITEIPDHWPEDYRSVVQKRIDLIESDKFIGLLERPEYKRRWASDPWEKRQDKALRRWILERLEDRAYWFDRDDRPQPRSIAQLADQVARDADLVSVIGLWEGRPDAPLGESLAKLMVDEAVPSLAAHRLKETGLRKFAAWQRTWDLQRREDAGEDVGQIEVPPKYTSADFRKASWWQARGKLDVPKERFILYPDTGRAGDKSAVLGWAGWDHWQQALALGMLYMARQSEGAEPETLVPLVAGMAELQPWVEQWHNTDDSEFGVNRAEYAGDVLRTSAQEVGKTLARLDEWRPPAPARGRRKK